LLLGGGEVQRRSRIAIAAFLGAVLTIALVAGLIAWSQAGGMLELVARLVGFAALLVWSALGKAAWARHTWGEPVPHEMKLALAATFGVAAALLFPLWRPWFSQVF
jgi:arginine exporter protein ArgO